MYFVGTKGMATLALLLTLPVAAFENTMYAESGSTSVQLTDADAEVVEAWATVTDIYLQPASDDEDPAVEPVYLLKDVAQTRRMLDLEGDAASLIQAATVPAGTYDQLRIVMIEGCLKTDAGTVYATAGYEKCGPADGVLRMPSYAQTGLKVLLNEVEFTDGGPAMILDFDMSQAFGRATGKSWTMAPAISEAGFVLMAAIDATLSPGDVSIPSGVDLADFSATLLPATGDSARVDFADAGNDGTFEVSFGSKHPDDGPFDVRLNPPSDVSISVTPSSPATVSPAGGQTASVDWVLQSVTVNDGGVECPWWVCGL